jgi:molecular chaperone GrpE
LRSEETDMTDKENGPAKESGEPVADELVSAEEAEDRREPVVPEEDELERLKRRLAYLAAEFDNFRKRAAREQEAIVSFGNERILLAILPFLDNLERAISQAEGAGAADAFVSGVRMTYEQLIAELRKFGLEQIDAVGKVFDPNLHEAIARVATDAEAENTVKDEARKGYLLNGRLLRPAQVTVAHGGRAGDAPPESGQGSADGAA